MVSAKRNYGIDLLRVLAILGVVVLHILGHGNTLNTTTSAVGFSAAWFLEVLAFPAVDCFVLIAGFVGFRNEKYYPKLRNILSLFFTVLFYSVIICLSLKFIFNQSIGVFSIIKSFLPVTTSKYWFFTAYFAMFLISPMLNMFVHKANNKMLFIFCIVLLFLGACSTLRDAYKLHGGYSFVWFSLIYVLGALIKKSDICNKLSKKIFLAVFAASLLVTWLSKVVLYISGSYFRKLSSVLVSYCSPTIILMAVCLVCIFAKFNIAHFKKTISFFAVSAFSVYLIHDNPQIRTSFINGNFEFINNYNPFLIPVFVIVFALGIFISCTLIDKLRILIFKICNVSGLCEWIEIKVKKLVKAAYSKISLI